jgi:hypothetical protein
MCHAASILLLLLSSFNAAVLLLKTNAEAGFGMCRSLHLRVPQANRPGAPNFQAGETAGGQGMMGMLGSQTFG